jgi:hypothetical protein
MALIVISVLLAEFYVITFVAYPLILQHFYFDKCVYLKEPVGDLKKILDEQYLIILGKSALWALVPLVLTWTFALIWIKHGSLFVFFPPKEEFLYVDIILTLPCWIANIVIIRDQIRKKIAQQNSSQPVRHHLRSLMPLFLPIMNCLWIILNSIVIITLLSGIRH